MSRPPLARAAAAAAASPAFQADFGCPQRAPASSYRGEQPAGGRCAWELRVEKSRRLELRLSCGRPASRRTAGTSNSWALKGPRGFPGSPRGFRDGWPPDSLGKSPENEVVTGRGRARNPRAGVCGFPGRLKPSIGNSASLQSPLSPTPTGPIPIVQTSQWGEEINPFIFKKKRR